MDADVAPEDVAVLNEIARLQAALQAACDVRARSEIAGRLREQQLKLEGLREQRRRHQEPV